MSKPTPEEQHERLRELQRERIGSMFGLLFTVLLVLAALWWWTSRDPITTPDGAEWSPVVNEHWPSSTAFVPSVWRSEPEPGVVCYVTLGTFSDDLECVVLP